MTRLVVVSAGLSRPSSTRRLAERLAASSVEALGAAEVSHVELRDLARELADRTVTGRLAPALGAALAATSTADGLVAVTPVHSASYSGLFKTFFDVLERGALTGTPALVAATAGSPRHALVLDHALRPLFAHLRAAVVPTGVFATVDELPARPGSPLAERIDRAADELAAAIAATAAAPARRRTRPAPARASRNT